MKPTGIAVGTVGGEVREIAKPGKKPLLGFTLLCHDAALQYPIRVDCLTFDDDQGKHRAAVFGGAAVLVTGEVSADAYMNKSGEPRGSLRMFAKSVEAIGAAPAQGNAQTGAAASPAGPQAAAKAGETADDVPF